MLSVLIPVYNHDVTELVSEIHRQLTESKIEFEILVGDDASDEIFQKQYKSKTKLSNTLYFISEENNGRTANRQNLANIAKFEWILFLDADVLPKNVSFIGNYLEYMDLDFDLIFGGFHYDKSTFSVDKSLRYTFGKKREEQLAVTRNKTPYKTIISANLLIRKDIFIKMNDRAENVYGLDYYLTANLKENNIKVFHIDNEVVHLGLESNIVFIDKAKRAVETLFKLHTNYTIKVSEINLLNTYRKISNFGMRPLAALFYRFFRKIMERNLTSKTPSMIVFDIYRLSYMCSLKS